MTNKKIGKSYLNRVRKLSGNEVPSFMKKAAAVVKYQKRVNSLKAKGAIPFVEKGFEKVSWDMYKKIEEPDAGSIWTITTIKNANDEDEKWLVVNVDDNDTIIRSVKASITKKAAAYYIEFTDFETREDAEKILDEHGAPVLMTAENRIYFEQEELEVVKILEGAGMHGIVMKHIAKKAAIIPGDTARYEYEPGKFQQVFVAGIESRDPETGENTFKVRPMRGGGEEHFIVEEKKLKSASVKGMKKTAKGLSENAKILLHLGVKTMGTFDPNEVLPFIEEELFMDEIDTVEGFLRWLHSEGKAFGRGNIDERFQEYVRSVNASKKTSHTPGAIVQVTIPQGHINEKYNGKIGEVVAAVPQRSKISFKDMPSLWFEDNTIRVVASCNVCNSDISLQSLKKLGKIKCKCGAFYSRRQLEKIAKTAKINKEASKKVKKVAQTFGDISIRGAHLYNADFVSEDQPPVVVVIQGDIYVVGSLTSVEKLFEKYEVPLSEDELNDVEDNIYFVGDDEIYTKDQYVNEIENFVKEEEDPKERSAWTDIAEQFKKITASIKKAKIVEKGNEFCVIAESGRSMGCYSTKPKAEERLKQVEKFKHMKGSKKAQNVIFWFDDPKALKNLRYLQGPPTSPAGEEELLEKPGLEEEKIEGEEVEKEASKKTAQDDRLKRFFDYMLTDEDYAISVAEDIVKDENTPKDVYDAISMELESGDAVEAAEKVASYLREHPKLVEEWYSEDIDFFTEKRSSRVKKSVRNFEVGDSVQIMDKEGNTNVVPKATIAKVDEYLGTDGQMHETVEVTGSMNEDEQMWYGEEEFQVVLLSSIEASKKKKIKVSTKIKKEAKEKIGGIVKEALEKKAVGVDGVQKPESEFEQVVDEHTVQLYFNWESRSEEFNQSVVLYTVSVDDRAIWESNGYQPTDEDQSNDNAEELVDAKAVFYDTIERIKKGEFSPEEFKKLEKLEKSKKTSHTPRAIVKEAQGGSSFESLRGGGGGTADTLEPMGWQVQESKTPELPEGEGEAEEIEEEIVIRVNPDDRSISVDFEGEKEEEVEKPIGAQVPPEKPIEKPKEELEEGESDLEEVPVNF